LPIYYVRVSLNIEGITQRDIVALSATPTKGKGKAIPLQAWTGPEDSRRLRLPDFVTTAQDCGRLSALRTGCLYPNK